MTPYEIVIYDKAYQFQGFVNAPNELRVHPRHNLTPTATFSIDADHIRVPELTAEGARVVIKKEGRQVLSGPVTVQSGNDFATGGTLALSVTGDFRILHNILAFPVPNHTLTGNTINGQTVEYYTITGAAETVLKTVLQANLDRLGRTDVTIAPDLGRGLSNTYTFRMHPIYDRLFPQFEQAGLGVSVIQENGGLLVDVYEPKLYPHELSVESGTLVGGSYTASSPEVTRVVVGGQGDGVNRTFKQYVDTNRETGWADIIEVLQDARDSGSADVYADRAWEAINEGSPRAGFSLELSETKHFRYGGDDGVNVGDKVPVRFGNFARTEVLREAELSWTPEDGDLDTPIVGEKQDDPNRKLARALRRALRGERDRKAH